jgi:hypothetical protein
LQDPLLLEVAAAVGAGNIVIGPIHDETEFVEGPGLPGRQDPDQPDDFHG